MWTQNLNTAYNVSRANNPSTVWVNCRGVPDPSIDFGGTKMSGCGWKGSHEHVESCRCPEAE